MTKLSDEWQTPETLFQEISAEHGPFDIDLCATVENTKCDIFYTDYLKDTVSKLEYTRWDRKEKKFFEYENRGLKFMLGTHHKITAFMNPPYSNPKPFIEKAWEDSKYCKIVCLVKADPSTKWWATFWNYEDIIEYETVDVGLGTGIPVAEYIAECHGPKPGCEVRFFPKRIQFDPPQQLIDSGEVWKVRNKWVQKCKECFGDGNTLGSQDQHRDDLKHLFKCPECKGKGYNMLSGPTFPSALLIFDRRGL